MMFDRKLAEVFGFSEADLIANRKGQVTDEQYKKLLSWNRSTILFQNFGLAFIVGFCAAFTVAFALADYYAPLLCAVPTGIVTFLLAAALAVSIFYDRRLYIAERRERSITSIQSLVKASRSK